MPYRKEIETLREAELILSGGSKKQPELAHLLALYERIITLQIALEESMREKIELQQIIKQGASCKTSLIPYDRGEGDDMREFIIT